MCEYVCVCVCACVCVGVQWRIKGAQPARAHLLKPKTKLTHKCVGPPPPPLLVLDLRDFRQWWRSGKSVRVRPPPPLISFFFFFGGGGDCATFEAGGGQKKKAPFLKILDPHMCVCVCVCVCVCLFIHLFMCILVV